MSLKSTLAKAVPQTIVVAQINKGTHRGDDWCTVISVINRTTTLKNTKDGGKEIIYKGKVVGWMRPNGQSWLDDEAYVDMRAAYDVILATEHDQYLEEQGEYLEDLDDE